MKPIMHSIGQLFPYNLFTYLLGLRKEKTQDMILEIM
jgi:hypothetical protein